MMTRNGLLLGIAAALLLGLAACNKAAEEEAAPTTPVAQAPVEAPPQRDTAGGNLPDPEGTAEQPVDLQFSSFTAGEQKLSDFRGKPTVVNLWAVW